MPYSDIGVNIFSIISSAIGVYAFVPFVCGIIRDQHPETKLVELQTTLKDTEELFRSVVEEGLLHPVRHVPHFGGYLAL